MRHKVDSILDTWKGLHNQNSHEQLGTPLGNHMSAQLSASTLGLDHWLGKLTRRVGKAGPAARASMTPPASMASMGSVMWRAHSWMTQGEMWASQGAPPSVSPLITVARLSRTR